MKFVKLSLLALSLGLFVASCGGGGETPKTDTVAAPATTAPPATPPPAADTAKPAAPAMDTTKKMDSKMETKTETKMDKKEEKKK